MGIWLVYDIAAVILILSFIAAGYRRGFVASVLKLLGTVVSLVISLVLCQPVADFVYNEFVHAHLIDYVDQRLLGNELTAGMADNISLLLEQFTQKGGDLFAPVGRMFANLPGLFGGVENDTLANAEQTLLQQIDSGVSLADAFTQAALQPTITLILQSVIFLIFFALLMLLVNFLIRLSGAFNSLPLIGTLNRISGGLLGGGEAVMILYILGVVAGLIIAAFGEKSWLSVDILEETKLLSHIIYFKL